MATFTAVQATGASADYMKYLYNGLSKDDRTSEPKLLDFSLVPWDGSFIKLVRGAYITLTTSTYGTWYTGFVTNDPELEFLGGKAGAGVWGYKVQATSDEYLLNLKNIGIVPPFINTDQGTILKYLVRILTPAGYTFDVTGIGAGQKIPRYVIDPSKKFSDVVKEFADSANYRFWSIGMAMHFVQRDSIACGIIVDGNSKHFTPSNLSLAPTSDSIINDVVVTGQIEPQNYITEYFVGDGVTGNIPMMSSVYGADASLLLDDDFSASQTDLTKWSVFDTAANFLQVNNGFLNALGGNNNNTFDVYYQSANLIPLEGNLRITHGEYDFLNSGTGTIAGIIGGLWTGTPARLSDTLFPGCIYGIRVEQNGTLRPITNGVVDLTQSAVASTSKRYILRTVIYHRQIIRYLRQYSYFALGGAVGFFGGTVVEDIADFQTYITEIDPTNAAVTNQYVWANLSISLAGSQTFANYCPVVSNDLHCTVTGITLSVPMQAALWIKKSGASSFAQQIVGANEIDSFDGLTPVATVTDQNNGVTTKSSLLGTSQYNSAQAVLQFFHDTTKQTSQIPQPGDQVYFRYRRPGAAIARVQDKVSIAAEATAWGDNGLRSLTRTDLSPLPRVSAECEFAAAALVNYTNYQHYQGTYTMERTPFITGVFTAEPLSGTVLKFQNLPASFPSYLQAEIVSEVQTTFDHSLGGECFTHSVSFGSVDPAIGAVARLRRTDDVFNPQDSIEVPSYIDVSAVGNTFVPDVVAPTLDSYDATNLHFNTNQTPPTGGGFEVRYTDESWGADAGKNLITRTTGSTQTFAVPRNTRGKVCFVKAFDGRNQCQWSEDLTQWFRGPNMGTVTNSTLVNPDGKSQRITTCVAGAISGNNFIDLGTFGTAVVGQASEWSISINGPVGCVVGLWLRDGSTHYISQSNVTTTGKWHRYTIGGNWPASSSGQITLIIVFDDVSCLGKSFQITRSSVEVGTSIETLYCKTNGSVYGAMSRFAAGIKVGFPLVPPAPTATLDLTNPTLPIMTVVLPAALTDVWGIEIRASDNSTVIKHIDLTDASFVTTWTMPTNASHTPSYFVYTYNLLGEYSVAYNATVSISLPTITAFVMDESLSRLEWTASNTQHVTSYVLEMNPGSSYNPADPLYTSSSSGTIALYSGQVAGSSFFNPWHFRITPFDAIGAGTGMDLNHSYTATGVVEFNGNEVAVIPAPATPTTDPVVPTPLSDYPTAVREAGWNNYAGNSRRPNIL